ncbi:suppressor of fused domain protein [Sphingomonas azotifigens]|uniref:suppressor of fused domain protein n=1 Tax=Sphingomonas azotifigens TaxID=330920 RepID=UPI000A03A87A|nr:suppressor of fused domain protein [Sphingomonas azotifigens]
MGAFGWLRGLFGANAQAVNDTEPTRIVSLAERSAEARAGFWAVLGPTSDRILSSAPAGSLWPGGHEAYRLIHRGSAILLATDGLSDPFDESASTNGFEIELFVEGPGEGAPAQVAGDGWMLEVLRRVAAIVAEEQGILRPLERHGPIPLELTNVSSSAAIAARLPAHFLTADDVLGVMIGAPDPDFATRIDDMPLSPVRVLPVVLLTAAELGEIRAGDSETRDAVLARLQASGVGHCSDLQRESIV